MTDGASPTRHSSHFWPVAVALAGICVVAFLMRSIGFQGVFLADRVLLDPGDGQYHARLALYTLANFPDVLTWDAYLNYPDGSAMPSFPLLALIVAALAWLVNGDASTVEHILAWWSPVTGALTTLPVYWGARVLAGRGVALGAALLTASLPILANSSHVGNADHLSFQVLLGATLLWLVLASLRPAMRGSRSWLLGVGLALARFTILLLWGGSLLYVLLADGLLLLTAAGASRRDVLAVHATCTLASGLLLLAVVGALPTPQGGPFSAISLSGFQVCVLLAESAVAGGAVFLARIRPGRSAPARLLHVVLLAVGVAGGGLLVPGLRAGLGLAIEFLATGGDQSIVILELLPLYPIPGRAAGPPPEGFFGFFAYLVPIAPLAALWVARDPARRASACVLAGWSAVLASLAIWQVRYGADFTPAGSIGFALLLSSVVRPLGRLRAGRALPALLAFSMGVALLWLPLRYAYLPGIATSLASIGAPPLDARTMATTPQGSLLTFMEQVRAVTPETAGYLEPGLPEYGILCRPRIGHSLHYVARRASPADGLLYTLSPKNFALNQRFFRLPSEKDAILIAEKLGTRYVLTMFFPGILEGSIEARLHFDAGLGGAAGGPLHHFRLVIEGPENGRPLSDLFGSPKPVDVLPYRLFEIVPGAVLEARGEPGAEMSVRLRLETSIRKRMVYRAQTVVDAEGVARIRVPYSTDSGAPTHALGLYRVQLGGETLAVRVSEEAVTSGAVVSVHARAGS